MNSASFSEPNLSRPTNSHRSRFRAARRVLQSAATLAVLSLFSGCLEISESTTVHRDGSGRMQVAVAGDGAVVTLERLGSLDPVLDGPNLERRRLMHEGMPVRLESVSFRNLGETYNNIGRYSLRTESGVTKLSKHIAGADRPDPDMDGVQIALAGRSYHLEFNVPGRVLSADKVRVWGQDYYPDRNGRTVTWIVPMADLLLHTNAGYAVDFQVRYD